MHVAMGKNDFNGRCRLSLTGRVVEGDAVFFRFTSDLPESISASAWCRDQTKHGLTLLEYAVAFSPINYVGAGTVFFAPGLNKR